MASATDHIAFPGLDEADLECLRAIGRTEHVADGTVVLRAGQPDIDFLTVASGRVEILNPADGGTSITVHEAGGFIGDVDLLTRRPIIFTAVARGDVTLIRVPGADLRRLLNTVPRLGEKLILAFQNRRDLLQASGASGGAAVGIRVIGPATCPDTNVVREFLHKNFVPFTWYDTDTPAGRDAFRSVGSPRKVPAVDCGGNAVGRVLLCPSLRDLAEAAGIWRHCPNRDVDLAVVGAGPAGIAAAVYAASEGLSTVVLDRVGPGGQAGGSSKIENFIGFPAGLSGTELATRGVLQMLKFGAQMVAPVCVERLDPAGSDSDPHQVHLDCGATIRARTVLVATGATWRRLTARNAARFERAGVYYACTAVESQKYERRDVAVVGAGNSAGQAAMFLAGDSDRTVHLLVRGPKLGPGMSSYLADRIRATPNIRVRTGVEIDAVEGASGAIEAVTLVSREGASPAGTLAVAAVFAFIGAEPHTAWLPDAVDRDELGYLRAGTDLTRTGRWPVADREPCPLETSIPRVLAAGDVRCGSTKRVGFAVGDGSLAVTCVHRLRG
jgi:thioredoxin reductase (NADPH)